MNFAYGCLGGAVAFLTLFAGPELLEAHARKEFKLRPMGVVVVFLLFGIQVVLGGYAALLSDASTLPQASAYGTATATIVGGVPRVLASLAN